MEFIETEETKFRTWEGGKINDMEETKLRTWEGVGNLLKGRKLNLGLLRGDHSIISPPPLPSP